MPRLANPVSPGFPAVAGSCWVTEAGTTIFPAEALALQKNCLPRVFEGSAGLITTDAPVTVTMDCGVVAPPVQVMVRSLRGGLAKLPALVQTRSSGRSTFAVNDATSLPAPPVSVQVPLPR